MNKILFILGSPRKKGTGYYLAKELKNQIYNHIGKEKETIIDEFYLSDTSYEYCRGCMNCFINGECELSKIDSYDFDKRLEQYQGIVIFVPTYIHQMPGKLKNCFDRMAFRFHEFPLIGKKVVIITYTASNGGDTLVDYTKGMFTMLGAEVVDSILVYEIEESFDLAINRMVVSVVEMIKRIKNNTFQIRSSQEKSFKYLKSVVQTEKEEKIATFKQKRWSEMMGYNSLKEYVEEKFILRN